MTKEQIQSEIDRIHEEILRLTEQENYLKKELHSAITDENTLALLNETMDVDDENSMAVSLNEYTKTTPIMDEFWNSQKRFLVFKNIFSIGKSWTRSSLIVVRARNGCKARGLNLTMTELKKRAGIVMTDDYIKRVPENSRFYALASELSIAAQKITPDSEFIPFESPVRLGGQTFANQTGYGSIYEGTYQISQGTLYGETTGFYIIGIKTQK